MNRGRSATTTKVFVGSLPPGVTAEDLRRLFQPYGAIAECDISNKCGFLHLEDHDLAMKAIADLNGTEFMGGRISVEKGRVKPRRGPGGPMRGGKDRGGPYARGGGDFRQRNGRDYQYNDRFGGYDRNPRFDRGGYGPRQFDDRRGGGNFGNNRFNNNTYPERQGYNERQPSYPDRPVGGAVPAYDDRRGYDDRYEPMNDRRDLVEPPRAANTFDRGVAQGDLYSRRDLGPKPVGSFNDRAYTAAPANGYDNTAAYGANTGYQTAAATGGYATNYTAAPMAPTGVYDDGRGYTSAAPPPQPYAAQGGYGDTYGTTANRSYDSAYPPLPQQRGCGAPILLPAREEKRL